MCRNIRNLFNFDPPVTPEEIEAAALQFVRKISGFQKPSRANAAAFAAAVSDVTGSATRLLASLETNAQPKSRAEAIAQARARNARRFSRDPALRSSPTPTGADRRSSRRTLTRAAASPPAAPHPDREST